MLFNSKQDIWYAKNPVSISACVDATLRLVLFSDEGDLVWFGFVGTIVCDVAFVIFMGRRSGAGLEIPEFGMSEIEQLIGSIWPKVIK